MHHQVLLNFEETANRFFQPDHLAPIQFFATYKRKIYLEPERVLMLAVLEDAISCLQKYATCTSGKYRRVFEETREWMLAEDDEWLFSFNNVCDAVGLNAGRLRRALIQMAESRCKGVKRPTLNSAHHVYPSGGRQLKG